MSTTEWLVLVIVACIAIIIWKSKANEKKQTYPTPEESPTDDIRKPDLTESPDNVPHRSKDYANVDVPAEQVAVVTAAQDEVKAVVSKTAAESATVESKPTEHATAKPKQSRNKTKRRPKS